jgi:hypothetical protein
MNIADGEGLFACLFRSNLAVNVLTVESLSRTGITAHAGATQVGGFLAQLDSQWDAFLEGKQLAKAV